MLDPPNLCGSITFDNELLVKVKDQSALCNGVKLLVPLGSELAVRYSKIAYLYTSLLASPPLFSGVIVTLLCPSSSKFRSLLHLLVCFFSLNSVSAATLVDEPILVVCLVRFRSLPMVPMQLCLPVFVQTHGSTSHFLSTGHTSLSLSASLGFS